MEETKKIKAGDLVKKVGIVRYADGEREKVSKKTWVVVEQDGVLSLLLNGDISPVKKEDRYIVVGNTKKGLDKDFAPIQGVSAGSVPVKYRIHKDFKDKGWKKGDIVQIVGKISQETIDSGVLEQVSDKVPHKHVQIVVDPVQVGLLTNK